MRTHRTKHVEPIEAVGIVISDGAHGDVTSRLAAFVWGPAPEDIELELSRDEAVLAGVA